MHGQFIVVSSTFSNMYKVLWRRPCLDIWLWTKTVNMRLGQQHKERYLTSRKALGLRRGREYHGKYHGKIPWKNTMEKYHGKMSWKNPAEPLNFDFTYSPLDFGYWNEIIIGTLISHDHATKPGSGQSHYDKQVSWSLFSHINAYHSKEA